MLDPEPTLAAGRNRRQEDRSMMMIALGDPARPARIAGLRDQIAAGRYHPPDEAVAERLFAFFGPDPAG